MDKQRIKKLIWVGAGGLGALVILICVLVGALFNNRLNKAVQQAREEESARILDGIEQNITDGMSMLQSLREFYTDRIVVTNGNSLKFYPIDPYLRHNDYSQEKLVRLEDGELRYMENGEVASQKGIDVSNHQGDIDWAKVAADGVEFAILRVGIRGYETGKIVVDQRFEGNVKGALGNGIKVGVYFFSQSVNTDEAIEEAKVVLQQIAPYKITGPVVYDLERVNGSRTSHLNIKERTDMTVAFCETVREAGYYPMVYMNLDGAMNLFDLERLEVYEKWFAHYGTDMYFPYDYRMWQYSDEGRVDGIQGDVDLNISFRAWE